MSDDATTSSDTTEATADQGAGSPPTHVALAEGGDMRGGSYDISISHNDDGSAEMTAIHSSSRPDAVVGFTVTLTREQRYDVGQMLLEPNGSGYFRTSGRRDRALETEAERIEREQAAEKAKADAEKAGKL